MPLLEKIEELCDEITSLKSKEQKLMLEIKKRGDLARQLCSAKDEEIKQLRDKLHYDQRQQNQAATSSQRRNSVPTLDHTQEIEPPSDHSSQQEGAPGSQSPEASSSLNTHPSRDGFSQAHEISSIEFTEEDVRLSPFTFMFLGSLSLLHLQLDHLVELARTHVQRNFDHPKDLPLTPLS